MEKDKKKEGRDLDTHIQIDRVTEQASLSCGYEI
jgi:hypothetical protein